MEHKFNANDQRPLALRPNVNADLGQGGQMRSTRFLPAIAIVVVCVAPANGFAGFITAEMVAPNAIASAPIPAWNSQWILPVAQRETGGIDKSCIMMCDKWGANGCDKWVMRCKGDPGYPKTIQQLKRGG
jgi:hypothetical protein